MKYEIEYEPVLKQWVVFKVDGSLKIDVFKHRLKKCCTEFKKTMEERSKNGNRRNSNRYF